jgi:hypothetical protein
MSMYFLLNYTLKIALKHKISMSHLALQNVIIND